MAKILTGSTLSYGSVLPAPDKTSDGGMFFLLNDYTDPAGSPSNPSGAAISRGAGLYVFSFQQDISSAIPGDQVGQGWKQVSSLVQYLPLAGGTLTGGLNVLGGVRAAKGPPTNSDNSTSGFSFGVDGDTGLFSALDAIPNGGSRLSLYINSVEQFAVTSAGVGYISGAQIWTTGNMGSGSGLNADLLDGLDSSYFLNSANQTGVITVARGGTNNSSTTIGGVLYGSSSTQLSTSVAGTSGQLLQSGGTAAPTWVTPTSLIVGAGLGVKNGAAAGGITLTFNTTVQGGSPTNIWGNTDGTNSYLYALSGITVGTASNALALGGNVGSVSATPNTLVLRDASGYTYSVYANQSSPNSEGITISQIMVTNGSDNFLRKVSISTLLNQLNLSSQYLPLTGGSLSGSLNVNSISLNASTNSISVPGNSTFGNGISVNGTTNSSFNANVLMNGALTVNGNILANGSNMIASSGQFIAGQSGSTGLIKVTASGSGNSGYVEFYGGTAGIRSGYIGNTGATASNDTGNISYVSGVHSFTGNINVTGTAILQSTLTLYGTLVANSGTLNVTGNIVASGNVTAYSDARLKKNVTLITNALDKVAAMDGVMYTMTETGARGTGVIAQNIQAVLPEAVQENSNGMLSVAYGNLAGVMIEAIKELKDQVESLKAELALLKAQ